MDNTPTNDPNSAVAIFADHLAAENAIQKLRDTGFDVKKLSIIGRDYHTEENVVGFYNVGDRMKYWGKFGAFWGGLWGALFGLFIRSAWKRLYLFGFLYVLAPLAALFLFFLPVSGAGFFRLKHGGPMFTLYLVLVNLPFGIVTALTAKGIIGKNA